MNLGGKINLFKIFQQSNTSSGPAPLPENNEEKVLGAIMHLLPLLGPLVPPHFWIFSILPPLVFWQLKRGQSIYLGAVGLEVINFQINAAGILSLITIITHIPLIGLVCVLVMPLAIISALVLMLLAGFEAYQGKFVRYPWIQRWVK